MSMISFAEGHMILTAKTKENVCIILDKFDKYLGQGSLSTSFYMDDAEVKQLENSALIICQFEGYGFQGDYLNNLKTLYDGFGEDEFLTKEFWKATFTFTNNDYVQEITKEIVDVIHCAGEELEGLEAKILDMKSYPVNPYMLFKYADFDDYAIASNYQLGEDFISEHDDFESYEGLRSSLLEQSIDSYIEENPKSSKKKAKDYVLNNIPCLRYIRKKKEYFE